jgi:hypothetical protein
VTPAFVVGISPRSGATRKSCGGLATAGVGYSMFSVGLAVASGDA